VLIFGFLSGLEAVVAQLFPSAHLQLRHTVAASVGRYCTWQGLKGLKSATISAVI